MQEDEEILQKEKMGVHKVFGCTENACGYPSDGRVRKEKE